MVNKGNRSRPASSGKQQKQKKPSTVVATTSSKDEKDKKTIKQERRQKDLMNMKRKMLNVYDDAVGEAESDEEAQEDTYEYKVPKNISDDEEIDEDLAFNSDDEGMYAELDEILKRNAKNKGKGKGKSKFDEEEEDEEEEDEEDLDDEEEEDGEYMDISDLLPTSTFDSEFVSPKKRKSSKKEVEDYEDGDEDEDEEDEDEEGDEDEKISNLDTMIGSLDRKKRRKLEEVTEAVKESEFNVAPKFNDDAKLGLEDLIGTLQETTGLSALKKKLSKLAHAEPIQTPLPQIKQDRIERKVAYEQAKDEVSKWTSFVKRNREAEHLSFPLNAPKKVHASNSLLTGNFEPSTELESKIEQVLEESGIKEKSLSDVQQLETNKLTVKEILQRRRELRKMRDLVFQFEQKAKRLKKIKSKKYRKILKKQKERENEKISFEDLKNMDPEAAKAEAERLLAERAKERMSLRHKANSRWAKALSQRAMDQTDTRQAINEKLRLAEDLTKKISNFESDSEDSEANSEDEEKELSGFKEMMEAEKVDLPQKGLMGLKFMQRGVEKARENALKVASGFDDYDEIEKTEAEVESSGNANSGRRSFAPSKEDDEEGLTDEKILKGKVQLDKVGLSASHKSKMSRPVSISLPEMNSTSSAPEEVFEVEEFPETEVVKKSEPVKGKANKKNKKQSQNEDFESLKTFDGAPEDAKELGQKQKQKQKQTAKETKEAKKQKIQEEEEEDEKENPWIQDTGKKPSKNSGSTLSKGEKMVKGLRAKSSSANNDDPQEDIDLTQALKVEKQPKKKDNKKQNQKSKKTDDGDEDVEENDEDDEDFSIKQRSLIERAFAADNVIDKDFEDEKKALMEADAPKAKEAVPGWGSWSGVGIKVSSKKPKKPKTKQNLPERKDSKLKNVIINEKKIKKASKYTTESVPFPYQNKEQYEKKMRVPLGKEWNSMGGFQQLNKPRVMVKQGLPIAPPVMNRKSKDLDK